MEVLKQISPRLVPEAPNDSPGKERPSSRASRAFMREKRKHKTKVLAKAIRRADVVIGALRSTIGRTPCVVTEEMIANMKPGSIVLDVSIDQGGCFETSRITNHSQPTFIKHDVTHYCVPNIASRVSRTASFALSNTLSPLLLEMGERGGTAELIRTHKGFRNGVYIFRGVLTNEVLGKVFDLQYKDIHLLLPGI